MKFAFALGRRSLDSITGALTDMIKELDGHSTAKRTEATVLKAQAVQTLDKATLASDEADRAEAISANISKIISV